MESIFSICIDGTLWILYIAKHSHSYRKSSKLLNTKHNPLYPSHCCTLTHKKTISPPFSRSTGGPSSYIQTPQRRIHALTHSSVYINLLIKHRGHARAAPVRCSPFPERRTVQSSKYSHGIYRYIRCLLHSPAEIRGPRWNGMERYVRKEPS